MIISGFPVTKVNLTVKMLHIYILHQDKSLGKKYITVRTCHFSSIWRYT